MKLLINLLFITLYIGAFYLWEVYPLNLLAIFAVIAMWIMLMRAYKKYFINSYEQLFFYLIALNLLLEGLLQPLEGNGFYLCALVFTIVILLYRKYSGKSCAHRCLFSGKEISKP